MEVVFEHGPDQVEPHLKLTLTRLGDDDLGELKGCDVEKPIYLLELGDVNPPFREGLAMWLDARGLEKLTINFWREIAKWSDEGKAKSKKGAFQVFLLKNGQRIALEEDKDYVTHSCNITILEGGRAKPGDTLDVLTVAAWRTEAKGPVEGFPL